MVPQRRGYWCITKMLVAICWLPTVIAQAQLMSPLILKFPLHGLRRPVRCHIKPEMRLLRMNSDGIFSLIQFPEHDVPSYAVLSLTWRGELEVTSRTLLVL